MLTLTISCVYYGKDLMLKIFISISLMTVYMLLPDSLLEPESLEFIFNSLIEFLLFLLALSSSVSSGRFRGMDTLFNIMTSGQLCNLLRRFHDN